MKKKFDFVSAKKYAENLNTEEDILNIKKDKLLSLRKKIIKKINLIESLNKKKSKKQKNILYMNFKKVILKIY